jgi:hypothetical protein
MPKEQLAKTLEAVCHKKCLGLDQDIFVVSLNRPFSVRTSQSAVGVAI